MNKYGIAIVAAGITAAVMSAHNKSQLAEIEHKHKLALDLKRSHDFAEGWEAAVESPHVMFEHHRTFVELNEK